MDNPTVITKRFVRTVFRQLGYKIVRTGQSYSPLPDALDWIQSSQNIRTVLDIGANNGDFAAFLSSHFKAHKTYAFEPLASCERDLRSKAERIPNFHVFNVALSDHSGTEILYENSYSPASSLLRMEKITKIEFPQTVGEIPRRVQVCPLDDLLNPDLLEKNIFVKVDVQGLEDRVIRGGRRVFSAAQCVLIEMSFVPMYEGQPLFEEVHSQLVEIGFRFAGLKNQINSPRTSRPSFAHCLYLRSDSPFFNFARTPCPSG